MAQLNLGISVDNHWESCSTHGRLEPNVACIQNTGEFEEANESSLPY